MRIYISHIIVLLTSILPAGRSTYAAATRERTQEPAVPTTVEQIQELIAKEADAQVEMADKWRQLHELDTLDCTYRWLVPLGHPLQRVAQNLWLHTARQIVISYCPCNRTEKERPPR